MSDFNKLSKRFSKYLTGWAFSMAILDDYCNVVSKIEGVDPKIIKERISKNATDKFDKAREDLS